MQYAIAIACWLGFAILGYKYISVHVPPADFAAVMEGWLIAWALIVVAAFLAMTTRQGRRRKEALERQKSRLADGNAQRAEGGADIRDV